MSEDDETAKWLDVSFIRQIRLGRPYYRIECCTVLEGNDGWDEMAATWNRRTPVREAFPEPADMDNDFNAMRKRVQESIERGPRRMTASDL